MNDLIQIIKILNQDEVDKLNSHIDTLMFNQNSVFGEKGDGTNVDVSIRTSTGTSIIVITLSTHVNFSIFDFSNCIFIIVSSSVKFVIGA